MKKVSSEYPTSKAVGFVNFSCFCGLDVYCFGDSEEGKPPLKAIEKLRALLNGQPAALYSTIDGPVVKCPACGIDLELPSAEVLAGFAHRSQRLVQSQPS